MFESKRTTNGMKIILPPINNPRPVSQQLPKRPKQYTYPHRPNTVDPLLPAMNRLKYLRKLKRLERGF